MRRLAVAFSLLVPMLFTFAACGEHPASPSFVVFFSDFSSRLDAPAQGAVSAAAKWATVHQGPVVVIGYADPNGSPAAAYDMSHARAQAVVDQLIRDGVAASRITKEARGSTDYTLSSQESRRVEIRILGS